MKKTRAIVVAGGVMVIALVVWLVFLRHHANDRTLRASGTVEATEVQLGFPSAGKIDSIRVHEGDLVKAGDELAALDRVEPQARLRQAQAQVDGARAVLDELERGSRAEEVAQARAARDAAAEKCDDARRDFARAKQLFDGGAISQEALDKVQTMLDVAQNQFTQAKEFFQQVETGPRRERIEAQQAALAQAEANVAAIEASLANMMLRAPFDGIVTVRHREPGEIVPAGSAVLTIINRDDRWVRIFVPEYRIGAVHPGLRATITTDTYREKSYSGEVTFIATEAEFTPKTVQTTEERVRLVYAVKVRLTGDPTYDLKPGMPADVELELP